MAPHPRFVGYTCQSWVVVLCLWLSQVAVAQVALSFGVWGWPHPHSSTGHCPGEGSLWWPCPHSGPLPALCACNPVWLHPLKSRLRQQPLTATPRTLRGPAKAAPGMVEKLVPEFREGNHLAETAPSLKSFCPAGSCTMGLWREG